MDKSCSPPLRILILLCAVNTLNFFDRQILAAVAEPIRIEWSLSDAEIGWLATSFTLLYAVIGTPLGRLADICTRKWQLAAGVAVWSVMTALSGFSGGFVSLLATRLGVGVGEAVCAPVSTSLIGDLFPARQRGRALSLFMLGLPIGIALSYSISGVIAQHFGWRAAFLLAGIPGLLLSLCIARIDEPPRGAAEAAGVGEARRNGPPFRLIMSIPTVWWIIASGALHNFNLYALGTFLPAFLIRYHRVTIQTAGWISAIIIGAMGALGMLLGGLFGDLAAARRANGRMLLATLAISLSIPACSIAIGLPSQTLVPFVATLGIAYALMYAYYPLIYATIHDVIEPSLRGTAMAVYFCSMYFLGASLGPVVTGWLSDYSLRRTLSAGSVTLPSSRALQDQMKAQALQHAMHLIPILGILLVVVLVCGTLSVARDRSRLQEWMSSFSPTAGI